MTAIFAKGLFACLVHMCSIASSPCIIYSPTGILGKVMCVFLKCRRVVYFARQGRALSAGELRAVLEQMNIEDTSTQIVMKTSSKLLIHALCSRLRNREDRGWIGVMNSGMFHAVAARLRMQGNRIVFQRVKNGYDNIGAKKARPGAGRRSEEHYRRG